MRNVIIVLSLIMTSHSFGSVGIFLKLSKRHSVPLSRLLTTRMGDQRFFSGNSYQSQEKKSHLSDEDLTQIRKIFDDQSDKLYEKMRDENYWDLDYAQHKMIEGIEDQGHTKDEAKEIFSSLDDYVDRQRALWNVPYYAALSITAVSMPATYFLVYHEGFYQSVLEIFPWLEHTSWDWSEPLVQSLLTTQTQSVIIFGSLMALGFRPYSHYRNSQLAKKLHKKSNIPIDTIKRFIKVDK